MLLLIRGDQETEACEEHGGAEGSGDAAVVDSYAIIEGSTRGRKSSSFGSAMSSLRITTGGDT